MNEAQKIDGDQAKWAESGEPRVTRAALESAEGAELDALVAHVGLLRLAPSPVWPHGESDDVLRNRAIGYADDWGLLEEAA